MDCAEAGAKTAKRVHQRSGRRNRVPGAERGAGINAAQGRSRIAVDDDLRARPVHRAGRERQRAVQVLAGVVVTQADGDLIGLQQRLLTGERLPQQLPDDVEIELQQRGQHAHVGDVLHQDARARVVEVFVAHARQGNAQDVHVLAAQHLSARPGGVVEQVTAGGQFAKVALIRLGVHCHRNIHAAGARQVAAVAGAHLIPGGQALDIGREIVLARDRDAHPEQGLHQQRIGAGRASAVYVGDANREIVVCRHEPFYQCTTPRCEPALPPSRSRPCACRANPGAADRRLRGARRESAIRISACPRPPSDSVRRRVRNARTGPRP